MTRRLGYKTTSEHNQKYCIIKIGQNAKKSYVELRKMVISQMTLTDYMCKEKKKEEDLPALKTR